MNMKIKIARVARKPSYTIGHLFIDRHYFCDTLEPPDRSLTSASTYDDILLAKCKGPTAIPQGIYHVTLTKSPKFGCILPLLMAVPGFEGIRIHAGNRPNDTRGCVLVGFNKLKGMVINSTSILRILIDRMNAAISRGMDVELEIR
jgi:hypothetical protein